MTEDKQRARISNDLFEMGVTAITKRVQEVNATNGWNAWTSNSPIEQLACLALIHSEVSEAVEAIRKSPVETLEADVFEELADVLIRTFDFAGGFADDGGEKLARAVIAKIEKNKSRGYRHGGKRA